MLETTLQPFESASTAQWLFFPWVADGWQSAAVWCNWAIKLIIAGAPRFSNWTRQLSAVNSNWWQQIPFPECVAINVLPCKMRHTSAETLYLRRFFKRVGGFFRNFRYFRIIKNLPASVSWVFRQGNEISELARLKNFQLKLNLWDARKNNLEHGCNALILAQKLENHFPRLLPRHLD